MENPKFEIRNPKDLARGAHEFGVGSPFASLVSDFGFRVSDLTGASCTKTIDRAGVISFE